MVLTFTAIITVLVLFCIGERIRMYKDKDKQREANRQASQRRRDKGMTNQGMTEIKSGTSVIPKQGSTAPPVECGVMTNSTPPPKRGKDIKCFADLPPDVQETIDMMSEVDGKIDQTMKANRTAAAINYQHLFPDSYGSGLCLVNVTGKPGDADYNGVCTEAWRAERGR